MQKLCEKKQWWIQGWRSKKPEDKSTSQWVLPNESRKPGIARSFSFVIHIISHESISDPVYYWLSTTYLNDFSAFFTEKLALQFCQDNGC